MDHHHRAVGGEGARPDPPGLTEAREAWLAAGERASAWAFRHNRWPSDETRAALEEAELDAAEAWDAYKRLRGPVDPEELY